MTKADLKHYQDGAGHVFSMTEADAKMLGYTPVEFADVKSRQRTADDAEQAKKNEQATEARRR